MTVSCATVNTAGITQLTIGNTANNVSFDTIVDDVTADV